MERYQLTLMRQRAAIERSIRRCELLALAYPENREMAEDIAILQSVIALLENFCELANRLNDKPTNH